MAGRICEAITFCCRWFTRRREDEEKEGLLTRDAQLLEDAAPPVQTNQPRVASGGLRERASVNNNNEDAYGDWERRDHVRRVARVGFQSRVQVQSHPLGPDEIETLLQNLATLRKEYSSIPSNLVTMADVPPGAEEKNRYKDILPNPQTRVSLFLKFAVANSDYINANFIRGLQDSERTYIATQGPLPWTVNDFWRMVWEQKTSVIVMVTGLEERRIVKCAQYWPDPQVTLTASYGDLNVTLKKRVTTNPNYTVSHFHVTHREKLVSREVTHFWFTAWPDHGVPSSTEPALHFLSHIRSHAQEIPAPIIVHCSAGIGRTGVFIGADMGMTQLEKEGQVDILKIVSTLRQDRGGMVQTEVQYIFLHQLLLSYARQLPSPSPSVQRRANVPGTTFN
jgi:tyrosine-protein phosphatase non-receptor type 7